MNELVILEGRVRQPWLAKLIASCLIFGCKGTEKPTQAETPKPDPLAIVSKALGKAHVPNESPWASRGACEEALERAKSTRTGQSSPRIATWNVRYFPDGSEKGPEQQPTDLDWLACAIALLDVDVLAVQEFKKTYRAKASAAQLIQKLNAVSGRDYQLELARCEPNEVQHPGILYDQKRVLAESLRDIPELNQAAKCTNEASPGFGSYLKFVDGPDFHLIVVHAYAGDTKVEHSKRQGFVGALEKLSLGLRRVASDTDLVVTGDFNTSGCRDCEPKLGSSDETRALGDRLLASKVAVRLLPATAPCTFVLRNEPVLLDHFLVSASMKEVPAAAKAQVSGYCGAAHCAGEVFPNPKAERHLSDHCPLILELSNQDED